MKQFFKDRTITYNLMSFTGFRALMLFSLLTEAPRSYEEICECFINHPYIKEKISKDTLRVYINSMKSIGCEIVNGYINGVYTYKIASNPFTFNITETQMRGFMKIYKIISKTMNIEEILAIHNFVEKLKTSVSNPEILDRYKKISLLRGININLLKALIPCVRKKEQIVVLYNSPNSGLKDMEILLDDFVIRNEKIYVKGCSSEHNQTGLFLLNRIKDIKEIKLTTTIDIPNKNLIVGFEYYGPIQYFKLKPNERIIKESKNKTLIEITSDNEFFLRQRILELADQAKIVYPESYKKDFIKCLEEMKEGYFA